MHIHFRLGKHNIYPWLFIACAVMTYAAIDLLVPPEKATEMYLPVTGAVAGFVYFLYSQHHQKTQLFVSLFEKFNARYEFLNDQLNAIITRQAEALTIEEIALLFGYFNLCAEEYLFYKSGYIDQDVWLSWISGMKYFARNSAIRSLWESELNSGSYYGFSLSLFDAVP